MKYDLENYFQDKKCHSYFINIFKFWRNVYNFLKSAIDIENGQRGMPTSD